MKNETIKPSKIITGEQLYSINKFLDSVRSLYHYEVCSESQKEHLDMFIDKLVLMVANDNSKNTIFLNYEKNKIKAYNILSNENGVKRTDCFNMEHAYKWNLFDNLFRLFAHFQIIKISNKFDEGTSHPKAQEIITNFKNSYSAFREDCSVKIGETIARQKLEIEHDFKNLQS